MRQHTGVLCNLHGPVNAYARLLGLALLALVFIVRVRNCASSSAVSDMHRCVLYVALLVVVNRTDRSTKHGAHAHVRLSLSDNKLCRSRTYELRFSGSNAP